MAGNERDRSTTPQPVANEEAGWPGLLDALPDGVVITDRSGTITCANERAAELFGYRVDQLLGRPVELLLPERDREVHRSHRLRYTASPTVRPMGSGLDLWGLRADGAEFPLEISLSPWPIAAGERYVAVVRDVSARLAEEEELRRVQRIATLADDRERIARDLHDTAIQELFATGLGLQGAAMQAPPELRERLSTAVDHLDAVIRQIRAAIFAMSSHRAEDSATVAVRDLVAQSQRSLGFRPVLRIDGPFDTVTDGELAADLLATLREALSNIARHARASRAGVTIEASAKGVVLTVADDGQGLERSGDGTPGQGLRNLLARAEQHGGSCTITSAGDGTALVWHVPL